MSAYAEHRTNADELNNSRKEILGNYCLMPIVVVNVHYIE